MANYDLQYEGPAIDSILDTGKKLEDDGYIFLGLAAANTTSGTPDKRVFYFAGPGSYSGFSVTIPTGAVGIFAYNGSAWVTSVINTGSIYDVSSANSGRTYASLSTAIEDIPSTARKAGMEIKFVNTSTSKYEVWIYQGISTSAVDFTNTANWIGVDETPLSGSNNLVSSGGVYEAIQNAFDKLDMIDSTGTSVQSIQINVTLRRNDGTEEDPDWQTVASLVLPSATTTKAGLMSADDKAKITNTDGVFDISEYTASGGTLTQYASLSAALGTNGINVPQNIRKGGMSVKFVQSSDNKYVQYRLMATSWSTTVSDWQGVDDEPTSGSGNLVKSGGVVKMYGRYIDNSEFVYAIVDAVKKIAFGIKNNGDVYFGAGVPSQIVQLLNNKVDKEINKGLIPLQYIQDIDNSDFVYAIVDAVKKIIASINSNGMAVFYGGIDTPKVGETLKGEISKISSNWAGKNIAYFGTSLPAQGYPQIVGEMLGATVYNKAVGSSMMRCGIPTEDYLNNNELGDDLGLGGVTFANIMRSMSRTQKELRHIFDNWTDDRRKANLIAKGYTAEQVANVKGYSYYIGGAFPEEGTDPTIAPRWPSSKPIDVYANSGETYKDFRQLAYSYCWDNSDGIEADLNISGAITEHIDGRLQKFIDGTIETDLFVFDHFRNDGLDSTSSQYLEIPANPTDRNYAEGAFNYLVQQILLIKPKAKIAIVGHVDNDDNRKMLGHVWEAQEIAANGWGFPLLKLWELLGIRCYRWVTTTGYWDNNGVWHDSGYNGSNHVWKSVNGLTAAQYENPRQVMINGVLTWVHDLTTRMIWFKDDVHPFGLALNHIANYIAKWLRTI